MNDENRFKEVCELLKIWYFIKSNNTTWPDATVALEMRINLLLEREFK